MMMMNEWLTCFHRLLGEVESVSQNRCQSRISMYNGKISQGLEASPHFTTRAHQNCSPIEGNQERTDTRDADVSGKLRNV